MIVVTRLDGRELVLNADLILMLESVPDTRVTMTTGLHLLVKEAIAEVIARVVEFRRNIGTTTLVSTPASASAPTPVEYDE